MTFTDDNVLRRRDRDSLARVEAAFHTGSLAEAVQDAPEIESRTDLSKAEFDNEYRRGQWPVVLRGHVADWPSVRTWTMDRLAQRVGDTMVVVDSYSSAASRRVPFAEFVRLLHQSAGTDAAPIYLQEWYYQTTNPELAEEMPELEIAQYDFRRNLYGDEASTNHQLWLGQEGAVTRLHQDSYMVDVMHAQISGEKHWYVMGPGAMLSDKYGDDRDLQALCGSPATQLMQCRLRPGDVLYLPAMWFHRIELRSNSIGLGRKCLDEVNLRLHIRQRMAELLALSLNADEVKQTHPELFDVVLLRNRAWAQRMGIDLAKLRP
jgi:hypothetical protein